MPTEIIRYVTINATAANLVDVMALLKNRGDVSYRVFDSGPDPEAASVDIAISGHLFRVEHVIREIQDLGVQVDPIRTPPFRYLVLAGAH